MASPTANKVAQLVDSTRSTADRSLRVTSLPTLRQQVVDRLKEAIEIGQFPPGTRLIERDLCERLGVSRTSVREALRELEAAGLITTQPNKGPIVSVVTEEMARSIYDVRGVLEGLAARLFARNASADQMSALRASVDQLAAAYSEDPPVGVVNAKTEFYRILLEGAGNPIVADMLRAIHTRVSQLRATSLSNPARAKASLAEIRDFVAALADRNEEAAWHLCLHHVQNAAEAALEMLRATEAARPAAEPIGRSSQRK